jgi:phenylalanyl-tRNA synthetase beta chain
MYLSKNWIRDFVFLPDALDADELAKRLSLATVEVENIIKKGADLDNIVVGEIKKIVSHQNADKLKVCQVDVGDEELQIVCGGSNIAEGMKVVVAKVGARVRWHGEGEPIVMEPATIRGVESRGMICASDEIGLVDQFPKKDEKEIVDLSAQKVKVGVPIAQALEINDVIFDIDNKSLSNRPDLWGQYGLAREIAALTHKKFTEIKPAAIKSGNEMVLSVDVQVPELCSRYMAVAVSGVSAIPSPAWLRTRLEAVGQRSIIVLVDVTNYVMWELGQPLHAFDAAEIVSPRPDTP